MEYAPLPATASWHHYWSRHGFEVVFCSEAGGSRRFSGATTATESFDGWIVSYDITVDELWHTRSATIESNVAGAKTLLTVESDGQGNWLINGLAADYLQGCLDLDLESSAMTNTFPIHRLNLDFGGTSEAPAAYVRAIDLSVERIEQIYTRTDDNNGRPRFHYESPGFDFSCDLLCDTSGLALDYPGIAVRQL